MLGTGIAAADEDVNPDKPASPLDGSASVPVHLQNNAVATPLGSHDVPAVHKDVTVRAADLTGAVPAGQVAPFADPLTGKARQAAGDQTAPVVDKGRNHAVSVTDGARDQATPLTDRTNAAGDRLNQLPGGDKLAHANLDKAHVPAVNAWDGGHVAGNHINVDLVVPLDISGNAIAVLGKATTTNDSSQSYGNDRDVTTTGAGGVISGNVVDVDWAAPVQVTNNAVAVLGSASAAGTSSQEAWATGDIVADGAHSVLGGNVVAPQFATPVQVDGNAVAGGGFADATSAADTSGEAGGFILTSGQDSVGGGNAVPVPVAVPTKVNGNAIMALGKSIAVADSSADAMAGATRTGMYGVPTYVETDGDPALAAGNIVDPSASGPVLLCGNAGGVGGIADATCDTSTEADAGGTNRTTGEGAIASGTIASVPVALPVEGFGNPVVAVGTATTDATNTADVTSGGDAYTRGHEGILSGTTASATPAGPIDVFANPIAAVGHAATTTDNTSTTDAGGHSGTTGDDSVGGGNMGTVPVAIPGEFFGNTAAGLGSTDATVTEDKTVESGGGSNTDDDNGLLASNLVNAPVATAVQGFGNGAGVLAFTDTTAVADDEVTAGGPSRATGVAGLGSGNIVQTPTSLPFQFFGNGATGAGRGSQIAINELDSEAGGDATSDGANALGGGNVVSVPTGGAGQVWGETVAALGKNSSLAGSITETEAGGDTQTTGEDGAVSGNVVSPQLLPVVQSLAVAASGVGGMNSTAATNQTEADSGGDIDTNGDSGFIAGNLVDVPAGAQVQPFGDAVSAIGSSSYAQGLSETNSEVGGSSNTSGSGLGSLSGMDLTLPLGADIPVYDVPVEVLAQAMTESVDSGTMEVGEDEPQINLPVSGGMESTEVPSLMRGARSMPSVDPVRGAFSGTLRGFEAGMTSLPGQQQVSGLPSVAPAGVPATAPTQHHVLPAPAARTAVPSVPAPAPAVPAVPSVPAAPAVPAPAAPAAPNLGHTVSPLSAIQPAKFGGFGRSNAVSPLSHAPVFGGMNDATTIIPVLGDADATTLLPVIPAAPVSANLPVLQQAPAMGPRTDESSLDSTRAALANLFATHSIG